MQLYLTVLSTVYCCITNRACFNDGLGSVSEQTQSCVKASPLDRAPEQGSGSEWENIHRGVSLCPSLFSLCSSSSSSGCLRPTARRLSHKTKTMPSADTFSTSFFFLLGKYMNCPDNRALWRKRRLGLWKRKRRGLKTCGVSLEEMWAPAAGHSLNGTSTERGEVSLWGRFESLSSSVFGKNARVCKSRVLCLWMKKAWFN